MQRVSLKTAFREKELWILVLLGILYFYRPLFLGETFFFRDLCLNILPQKQLLVDFMNARELPLWNPYLHGGQPYLADIPFFPLYPSNLLYLFLPFLWTFNFNIVLHFICCSVFAYLFSRIIGFQPLSSFIVGVIYGFCGYTLSLANLGVLLLPMPYLPLLFLFWHLYLFEGKNRWFVITVVIGVIQALAGMSEINLMGLLSLLGWSLFYPYSRTSLFQRFFLWCLLCMFIVGISAVQLFPTIEMVFQSSRSQGLSYNVFAQWSLHPRRSLELFFPKLLGHVDTLPWNVYYWGGKLVDDNGNPYILSIYWGGVVLMLTVVGGINKDKNRILPFSIRFFLFALFMLSLLLSFGRFLPFFSLLYQCVPMIKIFRYPIKFLLAGIFPVALLTGYTSEVHFGNSSSQHNTEWSPSSIIMRVLWSISVITLISTTVLWTSENFSNRILELFFKQSVGEVVHRGVGFSLAHATAIWLLAALLYQYRRVKRRYWQHWLLGCIIVVDLLSAGKKVNFYAPKELFIDTPPLIQLVHREIEDGGRFFRTKDPPDIILEVPPTNVFRISPNDLLWGYRWNLATLNSYSAAFFRIPVIFHEDFDGLAQVHLMKLRTFINSLPWKQRLPLLSAGRVTLILTSDDISVSGIRHIAEIPNRSNLSLHLYRNETAAARVEFITNWKHVASDNEALKVMLSPDYDSRDYVVLQESESTLFEWHFKTLKSQETASNFSHCDDPTQVTRIVSDTISARFSVSNNCDGYLVFSEPFYPGWRVYVDGKLSPILRANYAFSAVFLKAGEHKIERRYRPNSLFIGVFSSVIFCLLLSLITYKGWLKIED